VLQFTPRSTYFSLFQSSRIDSWAHPAFYSLCTWNSLEQGARRPGRKAGHSSPLGAEVNMSGTPAPVPPCNASRQLFVNIWTGTQCQKLVDRKLGVYRPIFCRQANLVISVHASTFINDVMATSFVYGPFVWLRTVLVQTSLYL